MLRLTVARDSKAVADAKHVRWQVYGEEEGMLPARAAERELQADDDDTRRPAVQLLVYSGALPVGTLRLQIAQVRSGRQPRERRLELESQFALSGFDQPGTVLGEVTRFCVVRAFRGTRVAALLFGGLRRESEAHGVTHWLAAANMETDSSEDADVAYRLVQQKHLMSDDFAARARAAARPNRTARRFIYTDEQRRAARRGALTDLKLPKTLGLFANKMGARYIGPPSYDAYFNVFALPLAVRLADLVPAPPPAVRAAEFSPAPRLFL